MRFLRQLQTRSLGKKVLQIGLEVEIMKTLYALWRADYMRFRKYTKGTWILSRFRACNRGFTP